MIKTTVYIHAPKMGPAVAARFVGSVCTSHTYVSEDIGMSLTLNVMPEDHKGLIAIRDAIDEVLNAVS